jgi:hypothetical protein
MTRSSSPSSVYVSGDLVRREDWVLESILSRIDS